MAGILSALRGFWSKGVAQKIAVVSVVAVIGFCSCCSALAVVGAATGGSNKPSVTSGTTTSIKHAPTATRVPTATPTPTATAVPPTATPVPQVPMLGGLKAPYDAKYGAGTYNSGDIAWEYHYDSPNDNRVLWLTLDSSVSDSNKARVVHIELGVNETWSDNTAAGKCNIFLPSDAQYQQTVTMAGVTDYEKVYMSHAESTLFTPDYFTDPHGNRVAAGTIYVQFFHDGTSHITGCTLGLGTNI